MLGSSAKFLAALATAAGRKGGGVGWGALRSKGVSKVKGGTAVPPPSALSSAVHLGGRSAGNEAARARTPRGKRSDATLIAATDVSLGASVIGMISQNSVNTINAMRHARATAWVAVGYPCFGFPIIPAVLS